MRMEVELIDVYLVYSSDNEWGTNRALAAVCRTTEEAVLAAEGQGFYGAAGNVSEVKAIRVDDERSPHDGKIWLLRGDPVEFSDVSEKKAELRKKGLDKLSDEERLAMGL